MTARKTEHCIDWSKSAAEIDAAFETMAQERDAAKKDAARLQGLLDAASKIVSELARPAAAIGASLP